MQRCLLCARKCVCWCVHVRKTLHQNLSKNEPTEKFKLNLIECFEHRQLRTHQFRATKYFFWVVQLKENIGPIFREFELHRKIILIVSILVRVFLPTFSGKGVQENLYQLAVTISQKVELLDILFPEHVSFFCFRMCRFFRDQAWLDDACLVFA